VPGLVVTANGAQVPASCPSAPTPECLVFGSRGSYHLIISARGFQSVEQTVQVTSSGTHGCNTCDIPNTQHLSITLTPATSL
jgi:hypothetical protein